MSLGELEQVVLFALVRAEGAEAHSAALIQELDDRLDRTVSPGALYTVLERLQEKGYVEGWIGDSTPERGGRRRKVYRLLPEGARALDRWYSGIRRLADGTTARIEALSREGL